jgi:hypothetical protein
MPRDRALDLPLEHARHSGAGSGRDMPRGGRGAGDKRPRPRTNPGPRDALIQQLNLPRGEARETVITNGRSYSLRGSEARTLATIGAFRVVEAGDLVEPGKGRDAWHGDLERLQKSGLIEVRTAGGQRTLATLTREGQAVLDQHRRESHGTASQTYYAGIVKARYETAASRLSTAGNRLERVVLDYELKREYQRFLQENNRVHKRESGRPDRSPEEIRSWAEEHHLPMVDGRVQFPDVRIEYEQPDGNRGREDLELATEHYNSRQMGAKRAAGFAIHRSSAGRVRRGGASGRGTPFDPHAAEQVLR